jgi:hypothetical protein
MKAEISRRDFIKAGAGLAAVKEASLISSVFSGERVDPTSRSEQSTSGQEKFYVATNGNDANPGTETEPFATLLRAQSAVRDSKKRSRQPIWVIVRGGTYHLPQPLVFGPEDTGTDDAPITYCSYPGENVTLSGGRRLECRWKPYRDGIMQCALTEVKSEHINFTQLFVSGRRQIRARYPNYDAQNPLVDGSGYINAAGSVGADVSNPHPDPNASMTTWEVSHWEKESRGITFDPRTFAKRRWAKTHEAVIHIFNAPYWGNLQWRIKDIDWTSHIVWFGNGGWQNRGTMVDQRSRFYIENLFEELDSPGEWYLDEGEAVLYYMPALGVDLNTSVVEVPVLEHVIRFIGTQDEPVCRVTVDGFRIAHTISTFLEKYESPSPSDWTIHRGGAIFLDGARDCVIKNCWFDAVGGNAVFLSNYNRNNVVTGCKFTETGDSAICFVGSSDLTIGTQKDFPYECQATNNLIHDCGDFDKQIAGVYISRAKRITVGHNLMYNLPRAGICIGDSTWGGHIIEYNHIHHSVRETLDHGPFNAWGREPDWCLAHSHSPNQTAPHVTMRRVGETSIVRNNYLHDVMTNHRGGFYQALDFDDGSSNYHIYNNVCVGTAISIRDGDYRIVENNVIVNPVVPVGFHNGYDGNHDVFRRNIVCTVGDIYALNWAPPTEPWVHEIDYNLFFNPQTPWLYEPVMTIGHRDGKEEKYTFTQWQTRGYDQHSVVSDPLFVNLQENDYRLQPDSPALKLGFQSFAITDIGLTNEFPQHFRD